MLLSFSVKNFRSIRDEQEFSMVAGRLADADDPGTVLLASGVRALRVAAIYGANASGKTNVVRALHYMAAAVAHSHRSWAPGDAVRTEPFRLSEATQREPTSFDLHLFLDGTRYRYGFVIAPEGVLEEWLYAFPQGRQQTWYSRVRQSGKDEFKFGKNLGGANQAIRALTRENSLFLSAAAQNNHEQLTPIYKWFTERLAFVRGDRQHLAVSTARTSTNPERHARLVKLLSAADLGIQDISFEESDPDEKTKRAMEALSAASNAKLAEQFKVLRVLVSHRSADAGADVQFEIGDESAGTTALLGLLGPALNVIEHGGTLVVDELDASLHPLLALELVQLFGDNSRNPKNAQLIFNTHDTNLLDRRFLRRDQIWFCEKDKDGSTRIYPLSDFRPRKLENLERGYLQGRYGAVPFIGRLEVGGEESNP